RAPPAAGNSRAAWVSHGEGRRSASHTGARWSSRETGQWVSRRHRALNFLGVLVRRLRSIRVVVTDLTSAMSLCRVALVWTKFRGETTRSEVCHNGAGAHEWCVIMTCRLAAPGSPRVH